MIADSFVYGTPVLVYFIQISLSTPQFLGGRDLGEQRTNFGTYACVTVLIVK